MDQSTTGRPIPHRASSRTPTFDDRLLALAVASFEHAATTPIDDAPANRAALAGATDEAASSNARAGEGDRLLERRIVVRARAMAAAPAIAGWLSRLRGAGRAVLLVASLIVAALGWGAAHAALGLDRTRPTNIYWLLGGVLLPQTLILVAWLALNLLGPTSAAAISLGGALRAVVARGAARRLGHEPSAAAAGAALGLAYGRGALARWTIGLSTNALWSSFNVGCLAAVVVLLTLQQHQFCWESTLLSSAGYERFTRAVAWMPHGLGFATPDSAQIAAARFDPTAPRSFAPQDDAARAAWSGLLVGSVVTYGLAPRLLLLGLCMGLRRRARARFVLDPQDALLAPIAARLAPARAALDPSQTPDRGAGWTDVAWPPGAPQPTAGRSAPPTNGRGPRTVAPTGAPVVLALETPAPANGWPPAPLSGAATDLGRIESREQRRAMLARLRDATHAPRRAIVVGSLESTPDRGLGHLLGEVAAAVGAERVRVVLTGGDALRRKVGSGSPATSIAQRAADWRTLAARAGIDAAHVFEIDLDLLTAETASRLRALADDDVADASPDGVATRRLEPAFALIAAAASAWPDEPPLAEQAELHRRLARLHATDERSGGAGPLGRLRLALGNAAERVRSIDMQALPDDIAGHVTGDLIDHLRAASQRMTSMLPDALRRSPRWIAAGALAGAIGCVAAATIAAPVAIAALPMWSALGAAVGGALAATRSASGNRDDQAIDQARRPDWATAVRAAALLAVILELQGGGEARIASVLERAFPEPDPSPPTNATIVPWLDGVRHRVDLALVALNRAAAPASAASPGGAP